jgi:hypothetical protein
MPKVGNLENCKIYKVVSLNNPELVYYGHTSQTLAQRFTTHKSKANKSRSKQIIDKGDAVILLVEDYPCQSEDQARAREAFYILNNVCVNKNLPNRNHKDSMKNWQVTHKEHWNKYLRDRYANKKLMQLNINNNNGNQQIDQTV